MWKEALAAPGQTDDSYLALRQRLDRLIGRTQSVGIMPYRGYGTADEVMLWGRVPVQRDTMPDDGPSARKNVLAMYRRFNSPEIVGATVIAEMDGRSVTGVTDDKGYYRLILPPGAKVVWRGLAHRPGTPDGIRRSRGTGDGRRHSPDSRRRCRLWRHLRH
ncbi:MAG: hypothetical protein KDD92_02110 [Caldilineaceae bacterium]|nr:hypothetical protein [Caldilineaceae bacterium]